jgi:MULE transposase domain/FAR1 DNA-binding domain
MHNNETSSLKPDFSGPFITGEDAIKFAQNFANKNGFSLFKKCTIYDKNNELRNFTLMCSRSGSYDSKNKGTINTRNTGSKKTGCKFKWKSNKQNNRWFLHYDISEHNHELLSDESTSLIISKLTDEQENEVQILSQAGATPLSIKNVLKRKNPDQEFLIKSIYNTKQKNRNNLLNGRTPIQALFDKYYNNNNFITAFETDSNNNLTHFLFCKKESIELYKKFHTTITIDCTYKTNKFGMPLMNVVGMCSSNKTFFICFVFMVQEQYKNYFWGLRKIKDLIFKHTLPSIIVTDRELALMDSIKNVFPNSVNLLCIWHINKNIKARYSKLNKTKEDIDTFMESWNKVIYNSKIDEFEHQLYEFKRKYNSDIDIITYIDNTWINIHKEKFITAFTNEYLHFNSTSSSRVEGAHSIIKKYLLVSTGHVDTVCMKLELAISNQITEIKAKEQFDRINIKHLYRLPVFNNLIGNISDFAMNILYNQYKKIFTDNNFNNQECSLKLFKTMGIPCSHIIKNYLELSQPIEIEKIEKQWWITNLEDHQVFIQTGVQENNIDLILGSVRCLYENSTPYEKATIINSIAELTNVQLPNTLSNPIVQRIKGRPAGSLNNRNILPLSSTRRDPSLFEHVEAALGRKCNICKNTGHNRRTCPDSQSL